MAVERAFLRLTEHLPLLADWAFTPIAPVTCGLLEPARTIDVRAAMRARFTPVTSATRWGRAFQTVWFKVSLSIPQAWRGRTVALRFKSGHGLLFRDGRPWQGLDDEHEFAIVADPARGGERETLFIEAGASERFGKFTGPHGVSASLAIYNRSFVHVTQEMGTLLDIAGKLAVEHPLRRQIVRALNKAMDAVEAGLRFAKDGEFLQSRFAARAAMFGQPTSAPSVQSLATPEEIDRAARAARAELAVVQRPARVPYLPTVHAIGHGHIDHLWQWPLDETIRKCARTWSTALRLGKEFPGYVFLASQAGQYELVRQHYPAVFDGIVRAIRAGQWEPMTRLWLESDCMIATGEGLVRQLLWGTRWSRERLGGAVPSPIGWLPDSFGYCAQLPQILRRSGVPFFASSKMWWNDTNEPPHSSFRWRALDGSAVLAHFQRGYGRPFTGGDLVNEPANNKQSDVVNDVLYVYGHGDGGGGPSRQMAHFATKALRNQQGLPPIRPSTAAEFFRRLSRSAGELPQRTGELYNEFHRGTYTVQGAIKRGSRHGDVGLREAELWGCLAGVLVGFAMPADRLRRAWDLLLKSHFHDALAGSCIGSVHEGICADLAEVLASADAMRQSAMAAIAQRVEWSGPGRAVVVFNPLSWTRGGLVEVPLAGRRLAHLVNAAGEVLPQQIAGDGAHRRIVAWIADAPACGYVTVGLVAGSVPASASKASAIRIRGRRVTTPFHDIQIDPAGRFTRFYDRRAKRETLPRGRTANNLLVFNDLPAELGLETWDLDANYRNLVRELDSPADVRIVENGPARAVVRVRRRFGQSSLTQDIVFCPHSPRIDFVTRVDWRESHKLLKVSFPVDLDNPRARYEVQFGHVERPVTTNTSWEGAMFETPAQQWADLAEPDFGLSLLNDCKHGYDVFDGALRLSLLRAPKQNDPAADIGPHEFVYSAWLHQSDVNGGGTICAGHELNQPMRVAIPTAKPAGTLPASQSLIASDRASVIVHTLKPAEDGHGLVLRVFESAGVRAACRVSLGLPIARAEEVNLVEDAAGPVRLADGALRVNIRPFQIRSFRIVASNR